MWREEDSQHLELASLQSKGNTANVLGKGLAPWMGSV